MLNNNQQGQKMKTIVKTIKTLIGVDLLITFKKKNFFVFDCSGMTTNTKTNIERICHQYNFRIEKNGLNGMAIYVK